MKELFTKNRNGLTDEDIAGLLEELLAQYPDAKKVLIIPPDFTRCYAYAGPITQMLYKRLTEKGAEVDVMPALGTHMPMNDKEKEIFFAGIVPEEHILIHRWQTDTVKLGEVPAEFVRELSEGKYDQPVDVEVNHRLVDGGYDLILSVGQVVPHEVVGMANYSKNLFVGCGGRTMINRSHFIAAVCGIENALGVTDSPARKLYDYAQEHFISGKIPVVFILTVTEVDNEEVTVEGVFAGDTRKTFERAAEMSQEVNIVHEDRRAKKVVAWLNPEELKTTWVGNKGIYRSRMLVENDGELILLAPGVIAFGENEEMDIMTRRFGYRGTPYVLEHYNAGEFVNKEMSAAHLMHGSSEGRFKITYATRPENLSEEEIRGVGFDWLDYEEAVKRYDPAKLKDGWNTLEDGEEIYYISAPASGLWKYTERK